MISLDFEQSVADLIALAQSGQPVRFETMQAQAGVVVQAAASVDVEARSRAVGQMVDAILAAAPMRSAVVALACGALVESGAHPYLAIHAIITRLGATLGDAAIFAEACAAAALEAGTPLEEAVSAHGDAVGRTLPGDKAAAYAAVELYCRPAIAMISRSKRARRAANDEGRMIARLRRFPLPHRMVNWLLQLLAVLDDETYVVLHPESRKGFFVSTDGIAGNHQLMVLVEWAVMRPAQSGYLSGQSPTPDVVAAARRQVASPPNHTLRFHFADWRALQDDATVSLVDETTLWGEGIPADIPTLDDHRIVLLAPTRQPRTLIVAAPFQGLDATVTRVQPMLSAEVESWLARIRARQSA